MARKKRSRSKRSSQSTNHRDHAVQNPTSNTAAESETTVGIELASNAASVDESVEMDVKSLPELYSGLSETFDESEVSHFDANEFVDDSENHYTDDDFESETTPSVAAISMSEPSEQNAVLLAIQDNTRLLEGLIHRLEVGRLDIGSHAGQSQTNEQSLSDSVDSTAALSAEMEKIQASKSILEEENQELHDTIDGLRRRIDKLTTSKSSDHVAADDSSSDVAPTLTWEQQKEAILAQMEADQFDAENFIETLSSQSDEDWSIQPDLDPFEAVHGLFSTLKAVRTELECSQVEITQLKRTLSEQSQCAVDRSSATATGAAAIANLLGSDELVVEERQRLREMQTEWEEKFRKIEVETSLERAKLARERQRLNARLEEMESELVQARRENKSAEDTGHASRRWLAKLGLDNS